MKKKQLINCLWSRGNLLYFCLIAITVLFSSLSDIMAQLSMNIVNGEFQTQVSRETVLEDLLLLSESVTWLLKD